VSQGVALLLGETQLQLAVKLARDTDLLVYLQLAPGEDLAQARRAADDAGVYGRRLYLDQGPLTKLHLADNVADVLVADGKALSVPETEALRVLHPQGKALLGERELVKPLPPGLEDWSHPYHGPDNNPFSPDQVARAPYLTQFLADPRYAPLPQAAVAAAGRVFKVFGHIAFKEREEPWLNTLAAFNGYNGALLWRRPVPEGLMVHRNTLIATPTTVYFGDDKSCKVIDAATGELRDEIAPPADIAGGTFWKWMALQDGLLYALVGEAEQRDPVIRLRSDRHGWPWDPLSPGYNQPEHTWGYGRTLLALDPQTKRIVWTHKESEPTDSRALCLASGRLFLFRHGAYLACLDSRTGSELWRQTKASAPELFEAIGPYLPRQDWRTNWRTTAYLKCSAQALYFSGPAINRLVAVAATDGRLLWQHPYNNYQLILRDDGVYGLSGQIDQEVSRKFDPLTGQVLQEFKLGRRACTRPTSSIDAIFCRADEGSTRLDLADGVPGLVSPMRAQCQDGVTIANGLLYWWPSTCDCNLTLYGITCLGPAGKFDFAQQATDAERLERAAASDRPVPALDATPADWPTFRANSTASVSTESVLPTSPRELWRADLPPEVTPSPPTAADDLVFLGASDGVVRAFQAATGKLQWKAYTGGAVRLPPTIWQGRAFVGSGDGWVYAFAARNGELLWRFRAAPAERHIPVYGQLLSTWPAASGVLVANGVAYVAAGIVNYDGTHVYALDAATGRLKWQNNNSGHLDPAARTGVSVQGHLLLQEGRLYLAGGNVVSPAIYDVADGKCLNDLGLVHRRANNNVLASQSPRGWELYRLADRVLVSGKPLYSHPKYPVYDASVFNHILLASAGTRELAWVNSAKLTAYPALNPEQRQNVLRAWGKPAIAGLESAWDLECKGSLALAAGRNAVVVATATELLVLDLQTGRRLATLPLPAAPVPWGVALDRQGRIIVTLENGQVRCQG
jgi:outer membrane protein assembly factor BamB